MSSFPRRSARLSHHLAPDQSQARSLSSNSVPSFSQPSSTSTTSHPSPTNDSLIPPPPPPTPQQPQLKVNPPFVPQQPHLNAPLPSPSANDVDPFFGRPHSQPNPYVTQQSSLMSSQGQQQSQNQEQPSHLHPHTNSMSGTHPQTIPGMVAGQMPPDFLAEAAKRAQVACLMRDMGDITL